MRKTSAFFPAAAACLALGIGGVLLNAGSSRASTTTPGEFAANWYASAPYYDVQDPTPPDFTSLLAATGEKVVDLASVQGIKKQRQCELSWDGVHPYPSPYFPEAAALDIAQQQIAAAGGDIAVSFGSTGDTSLGAVCSSPATTAAMDLDAIEGVGASAVDLDLSAAELRDPTAVANDIGAASILQQNYPDLYFTLTLPGGPTGLSSDGTAALAVVTQDGLHPENISIRTGGPGFTGPAAQTTALRDFNAQLTEAFAGAGWTSAIAYAHEGLVATAGRADGGALTPAGFATVAAFARTVGMTRLTFWSVDRDQQCTAADTDHGRTGDCSGVAQTLYAFSTLAAEFAASTPMVPMPSQPDPHPSPSSTHTPQPTDCGNPHPSSSSS